MEQRSKVVIMIQKKTGLDHRHAKDFEIGIFNWCIDYAEKNKIIRNWVNSKFLSLYMEKCRSVISNIDKESYIQNNRLIDRLTEGEFCPHDIAFMKPENTFPERWKESIDAYMKKYENAYENKIEAMTDMYKCSKCKKRECTYYEMFTRSADEASSLFIRCINCGHSWRMG